MKEGCFCKASEAKEKWIIRGDVAHVPGMGCGKPTFEDKGTVRVDFPDGSAIITSPRRFRIIEAERVFDPSELIDKLMFTVKINSDYYVHTAEAAWAHDADGNETDDPVITLHCKKKGE